MRTKRVLLLVGAASSMLTFFVLKHKVKQERFVDTSTVDTFQESVLSRATEMKNNRRRPHATSNDATQMLDEPKGGEKQPTLLWREDFSKQPAGSPDTTVWNVAGPKTPIYNQEMQLYSSALQNVRIANGRLIIEARQTPAGITSGRIDTKGKRTVRVGSRIEARIKLPTGKGTWPAFWLLSDNQPHTAKLQPTENDWQTERFYMHDGEIDVMEAYGSQPGLIEATVHTFDRSLEKQHSLSDSQGAFHTYWLEWREDSLLFGVDDVTYSRYRKTGGLTAWPFTKDNHFYVIINLAMGGSGGGEVIPAKGDDWRMEVASVSCYKL